MLSGRTARRAAIVGLMAAMLITTIPPAPAGAYHRERQKQLERLIKQKQRALADARARERDLLSRINESDQRETELRRRLSAIEAKLGAARDELSILEARADRLMVELQIATRELEDTLARLHDQISLLNSHVSEAYIFLPQGMSGTMRAAQSLEDVVAATEYAANIVRSDLRVVQDIRDTKKDIEVKRRSIERKRKAVEADRRAAVETAKRIAVAHEQSAQAKAAVDRELSYRRRLLREVRDEKEAYERALESYRNESADIARYLRGRQGGGNSVIQGRGGWLRWPVSGRISSGYGWRTHPIYGNRSFHSGIDIAAPSGRSVNAARYGRVLATGYRGAYGLIVLVDHGEGIATMYAHLSRIYVREGQSVSTSQSIAAVGSTGWSTGPHLHFEVRSGGEPTNPMRWL
ncbi:MAG TPA: peptidoglycan DD-metalloendopeptidase family protein [Actinomycetota bacterium]|nr:peptidoglycan DD-metalloendopeptidase family protein [Actinomycetota bacterium]